MILDIFSSFDPFNYTSWQLHPYTLHFSIHLFWVFLLLPVAIAYSSFWLSPSYPSWFTAETITTSYFQTKRTNGINLLSFPTILSALFITLIFINLLGIIPYIISFSSHLLFSVSLGFPLWLSLIISGFMFNSKTALANLLPGGAPTWLNPALILIETIRILVRPITLTVRLAANIRAGHIVLGLIGIYCAARIRSSFSNTFLLLTIQTGYTVFEFGICIIQAYIFFLLLSLYADEHPPSF